MTPVYRIKNWAAHYENAESRKLKKLSRVYCPNSFDTRGFKRLSRMPDEVKIPVLAAFKLIQAVASRCPIRGVLADQDGHPYTAADLEDMTGFPERIFEQAFEVLSSSTHRIGWMEQADVVEKFREHLPASPDTSGKSPDERKKERKKETGTGTGKGKKGPCLNTPENMELFISQVSTCFGLDADERRAQAPSFAAVFNRACRTGDDPRALIRKIVNAAARAARSKTLVKPIAAWQARVLEIMENHHG